MRAAVLHEHGPVENIRLEEFPTPTPPPDWVLIRVRACSINHHDIFTRRGMPGIRIPLPLIVGSDVAGEVVEVGEGVTEWKPGDRVLIDPMPSEEVDYRFIGETMHGGRAEFCLGHRHKLLAIPVSVSFETAAAIPLAYATARRMIMTIGQVTAGERVVILGASGGVGTAAVQICRMLGAEVIACASDNEKLARLTALGANHVVNYRATPFREAIWSIAGKPKAKGGSEGVDVVINSTGGDTWIDSLRCLRRGGRLLTCGATAGFQEKVDIRYIWTLELQVRGSNGWTREDIQALLDLADQGVMSPVIDSVVSLDEIHAAERRVENREVFGKVVVTP